MFLNQLCLKLLHDRGSLIPAIVITSSRTVVSKLLHGVSSINFLKALIHPRYCDNSLELLQILVDHQSILETI